jgi:hypothetical protein
VGANSNFEVTFQPWPVARIHGMLDDPKGAAPFKEPAISHPLVEECAVKAMTGE